MFRLIVGLLLVPALHLAVPSPAPADKVYGGTIPSLEYDIDASNAIALCKAVEVVTDKTAKEGQPEKTSSYQVKVVKILKQSGTFKLKVGQVIETIQSEKLVPDSPESQFVYFFKEDDTSGYSRKINLGQPTLPILGSDLRCLAVDMHNKIVFNPQVLLKQIDLRIKGYCESHPDYQDDWVCADGFLTEYLSVKNEKTRYDLLVPPDPSMITLMENVPDEYYSWVIGQYFCSSGGEHKKPARDELLVKAIEDTRTVHWYLQLEKARGKVPPNHVNLLRDKKMIFQQKIPDWNIFDWHFMYSSGGTCLMRKESNGNRYAPGLVSLFDISRNNRSPATPIFEAGYAKKSWFYPAHEFGRRDQLILLSGLYGELTVYDLVRHKTVWSHKIKGAPVVPPRALIKTDPDGIDRSVLKPDRDRIVIAPWRKMLLNPRERPDWPEMILVSSDGCYLFQSVVQKRGESSDSHLFIWEMTSGKQLVSRVEKNCSELWNCRFYLAAQSPEVFALNPAKVQRHKDEVFNEAALCDRLDLNTGKALPWNQEHYIQSSQGNAIVELTFDGKGLMKHSRKVWEAKLRQRQQ